MLSRCSLGAALALVTLTVPARAQEVTLEWKFHEGDKFYLQTVNSFKQGMKTLGREFRQDFDTTFVFSVAVQKVNADRSAVLEEKVESVDVKNTGQPTGALPAEDKFNQQIKGAALRLTVTPRGEVTRVEGYDDLVKKIAGDDASARKAVQAVLSEDYLKSAATVVLLPAGPVKPGAEWGSDQKVEMPLGPLGSFTTTRTSTYDGKENFENRSLDKISFKGKAAYNLPSKSGDAGPFAFKLTKGDLSVEDLHGTVYFDAARGRLVQAQTVMHVKGTLTVDASGNPIEAELQQDRTVTTRLLDKLPESETTPRQP